MTVEATGQVPTLHSPKSGPDAQGASRQFLEDLNKHFVFSTLRGKFR